MLGLSLKVSYELKLKTHLNPTFAVHKLITYMFIGQLTNTACYANCHGMSLEYKSRLRERNKKNMEYYVGDYYSDTH